MILNNRNCALIAGSTLAIYLTSKLYKCYRTYQLAMQINKKLESRKENFYAVLKLISTDDAEVLQKRRDIINMNFETLRNALQSGHISPTEVLLAFQWKAMEAQNATNCICEFLLEASVWAKELENKCGQSDNKPPLYGIPVSLKECNFVRGHDATMGMATFVNQPVEMDSCLVTTLKSLGAVPFVLTNVPQTMMSVGSSNPVFGITCNPHNAELSSGGSSSGEGALIGSRGSFLGVGSDIGGSVRVPAHCCGICSLKPTVGRLSLEGRGPELGETLVLPTCGPMGVDVDSLIYFCKFVWHPETKNTDPTVIPLPFREDLFLSGSQLTIGYYDYDGYIETTPACKRAVAVAKALLSSMGHALVPFEPPSVPHLMALYGACVLPDSGHYLGQLYKSDIVDKFHRSAVCFFSTPLWLKKLIGICTKPCCFKTSLIYGAAACDTKQIRAIFCAIQKYKRDFIKKWQSAKLDCMLCPVMASEALTPEDMAKMYVYGWNYAGLYNALNFPSGVIPVIVTNDQDHKNMMKSYKATDCYSKVIRHSFDTTTRKPMPVGVQIVALPFQDELCLRVMKELEVGLKRNFN